MLFFLQQAKCQNINSSLKLHCSIFVFFHRDIVMLYDSLEPILDTPSKCILWKFILLSLQPQHYDYILHRVGLPQHLLTGK